MMTHWSVLVPVLAGLVLAGPVRAMDNRCAAPDGTAGTPVPLSHAAATLHPGGTLDVLVIGSATVFGPEAALATGSLASRMAARSDGPAPSAPAAGPAPSRGASPGAFPLVMGRALEAAMPGVAVHIAVRGGRGMAATEMVDLMRTALEEHHYQLVIWQTGTVEAVRNVQPGDFSQTLADGEQVARDAGADLVLVDPQYSRFLQTSANLDPYLQAFGQAAAVPDVVWFRRYDLMRNWVGDGQIDLEHTPKAERHAAVELLHACLGAHLAALVADSLRS